MKTHSTNYFNTFIRVADDCPAVTGEIPPVKGDKKTVANMQFELISRNPYKLSSDDILFQVFADKNDLLKKEYKPAREKFYAKGQPCLRASPLAKRYGWGFHFDKEGKVAVYGVETNEYAKLSSDPNLKVLSAMKSSR